MKTNEQRFNNIIGQLEGAKKMLVDSDRDCFSLLIQLKAIKSALASLMKKIVSEEFDHCLIDQKDGNKEKMIQIFKEVIDGR
ncbi:MAG: metal-sensitive transcriptional regulator [Patescibacteria group bacterium]|jgi:DNA-binding FrmR family transcriptional regulator